MYGRGTTDFESVARAGVDTGSAQDAQGIEMENGRMMGERGRHHNVALRIEDRNTIGFIGRSVAIITYLPNRKQCYDPENDDVT